MQVDDNHTTHYFLFSFFKVDPKWRWMADLAKEESAKEVENIIKNSGINFRSYSTLGLRSDADFLFWFESEQIEQIQDIMSNLYSTVFGKYIDSTQTFLSCTRPSQYVQKKTTSSSFVSELPPKKYIIVYPFIKTREWYLLPEQQRQVMMDEHIKIGQNYPQIILNTTYSFGIDDEDFMLAFECDNLVDFQSLIMDLRKTQVSRYVAKDTPMIVGIKKDIITLISSLG